MDDRGKGARSASLVDHNDATRSGPTIATAIGNLEKALDEAMRKAGRLSI